ncbi:laccase-1 [Coprinopsis cinerea okayama7|uniref:Laccase-1 n=1 Tax=Coprinopsis cinerea (strain Okayama-7 / 130 / ATCC MYA-4618 / FGSC 9003) TaxID=240176 RepID=A8NCW1_COPC7|nr:laccase-1 [Coprinopsis cinerea okayama7\|eukprot:XP_001832641.2 laccase-1 [Coprinopsis cinerea okayama7\
MFSFISSKLALLVQLALASTTFAAHVNYTFNIVNANLAPDGFTRPTVVVNGQFPGTLIQANKDDILHITVNNQLTNPLMRRSTAIHWHGLVRSQLLTESVALAEDIYSFKGKPLLRMDRLALHSAPSLRAIRTPMISLSMDRQEPIDPDDPHKSLYDEDDANTIIQLGDWYHKPAPGIQAAYLADRTDEPVPDCGTINGVGRYVRGPRLPWSRINVVRGKRYRLRVINISAYGSFEFSIENHPVTIIEVDGINHVPKTVGGFEIFAGQRYSVVLNANQPVRNYWIRAPMDVKGDSDNDNLDDELIYAVLHYDGAPNADPTTRADRDADNMLREHELVPLDNPGVPGGTGPADRVIDLQYSRSTSGGTKWTFNGIQYHSPNTNTLLKVMAGATIASDFTPSEHTIILNHNETVELRLHGSSNGHVHVIKGESGPENYVNPPRRDVFGIKSGTGIIRFRTDNPGPWFLHCHWHLEAGLAVVFAEAPDQIRDGPQAQVIKQEWLDLCPIYNALPPELQ